MSTLGMSAILMGTLEEVKVKAQSALKSQGFGILTEIDVKKTMKEKIGVDYEPFLILGVCNPLLANQALTADRNIGLLLPCTMTLRQVGASVEVNILDPEVMFSLVDPELGKTLAGLLQEAKRRLQATLASLEGE
jgi:uncharacterized protein (DUF302 family)